MWCRSVWLAVLACALPWGVAAKESICHGTTSNGQLQHGVSLPLSGANFAAYSSLGWGLGRTYLHSRVHAVVLDAFSKLETRLPKHSFVYGETGLETGGPFKPHRTHQNGLSVDIMVPVLRSGKPATLPGHAFNRFGYDIEFDAQGRYEDYAIDFEALAALILQLQRSGKQHGAGIDQVIFDPALRAKLFATRQGKQLSESIKFMKNQAWVRHDEHIHVDFSVACKPLR